MHRYENASDEHFTRVSDPSEVTFMVPRCWQGVKVLIFLGRLINDECVRRRHVVALQAAAEAWRCSVFCGEAGREAAASSAPTPMQRTPCAQPGG